MSETVKYVGLDVHKNTIAVAVAEGEKRGEGLYPDGRHSCLSCRWSDPLARP